MLLNLSPNKNQTSNYQTSARIHPSIVKFLKVISFILEHSDSLILFVKISSKLSIFFSMAQRSQSQKCKRQLQLELFREITSRLLRNWQSKQVLLAHRILIPKELHSPVKSLDVELATFRSYQIKMEWKKSNFRMKMRLGEYTIE